MWHLARLHVAQGLDLPPRGTRDAGPVDGGLRAAPSLLKKLTECGLSSEARAGARASGGDHSLEVFDLMALQDEIHRNLLAMTLRHALFRAQETHRRREFV
jgi:hypothetical protein